MNGGCELDVATALAHALATVLEEAADGTPEQIAALPALVGGLMEHIAICVHDGAGPMPFISDEVGSADAARVARSAHPAARDAASDIAAILFATPSRTGPAFRARVRDAIVRLGAARALAVARHVQLAARFRPPVAD